MKFFVTKRGNKMARRYPTLTIFPPSYSRLEGILMGNFSRLLNTATHRILLKNRMQMKCKIQTISEDFNIWPMKWSFSSQSRKKQRVKTNKIIWDNKSPHFHVFPTFSQQRHEAKKIIIYFSKLWRGIGLGLFYLSQPR